LGFYVQEAVKNSSINHCGLDNRDSIGLGSIGGLQDGFRLVNMNQIGPLSTTGLQSRIGLIDARSPHGREVNGKEKRLGERSRD
jgi:hypothetical protein